MAFNCDFDAPMYVDFENLEGDGHAADDFFESRRDDFPLEDTKTTEADNDEAPPKLPPRATGPQPLRSSNTNVDHLRPKESPTSSLKTINKSAKKHITKEQTVQMLRRLVPTNLAIKPKFVSMAEENRKYFGTPERFRRSARSTVKPRSSSANAHLGPRPRSPSPSVKRSIFATKPQTPKLLTRSRTRCNHQPEAEPLKISTAEKRLASLKKHLTDQQIRATTTSKLREEKAKAVPVPLKKPLKTVQHIGIPIMLHNKLHQPGSSSKVPKVAASAVPSNSMKPISANSVHIKLYEKDKEIRDKLERGRERERQRERELAHFKAKDARVLSERPFMAKRSDRSPVRPKDLNLRTERRSEHRKQFDQQLKEKDAEMEALKKQELEKLEKREQEQVEKQRNATVHKANPVRCYKNVDIRPSDRPVTLPKTPNFSLTRTRHRSS